MVKVDSKKMFEDSRKKGYAIPHANFIDWNSARAFVSVAEEKQLPLILAFAQSHSDIISLEEAACIGNFFSTHAKVPVVLHLDHGEDFEFIKKSIDLGFSSVMIDASQKSFAENISITKKVVEYAHARGIVVEAELGHVGANQSTETDQLTDSIYTEVDVVIEFVNQTKIDSLAISIGTAHGIYKGRPKINFERLREIKNRTDIPLVLHGGSSSGDDNLKKCAKQGISKINIYTDFIVSALKASQSQKFSDYISEKNACEDAMKLVLQHYYQVFETKGINYGKEKN